MQPCEKVYDEMLLQNILEKFEFFPIKCHLQRSQDIFKISEEHMLETNNEHSFKAKVSIHNIPWNVKILIL
jgi:hypothetical protein